jgi:N-acyl-D-aspartate/D-glutamate deacylase
MQGAMDAAMRDGAFGVSYALIYPPDAYADTDEVAAICEVVAAHRGVYITHVRSEADWLDEGIAEAIELGRRTGVAVEIYHLKASGRRNWGKMPGVIAAITAARAEGIDVTADMYPWIATANGLDADIPAWAQEGGVDALLARMRDPAQRERIVAEIASDLRPEDILILSAVTPEVKKHVGQRLDAAAKEMGKSPAEALVDLVEMDRARVGVARFGLSEEDVRFGLSQPWVAMDTDYGAMGIDGPFAAEGSAHPRAFASTARILGHYARDLKLFSVEEAVRKMTSLPARRIGLWDRGILRPGMYADVVVFDPEHVEDTATFAQPDQYPRGIEVVIVNGRIALEGGKRTSLRAGKPLLHRP